MLVEAIMVADTAHVRYCLHDLVGLHARRSAESRSRNGRGPYGRWCRWFLDHAAAADRVVMPLRRHLGNRTPAPVGFDSRASALDWLEEVLPNLVACLHTAFRHGWNE